MACSNKFKSIRSRLSVLLWKGSNKENFSFCSESGIGKEWHPAKNQKISPIDVLPNSNRKVWWRCRFGHDWRATVASRNSGTGCPKCSPQTSRPELRVYSEIKSLFPDAQNRRKVFGIECDIYIPSLKLGIEVDGVYWHRHKLEMDIKKRRALEHKGRELLRLRGEGLGKTSDIDVVFDSKATDLEVMHMTIRKIIGLLQDEDNRRDRLLGYIEAGTLAGEKLYKRLFSRLPSALPGQSLADKAPDIAVEWHPKRNGKLSPSDITAQSNRSIWWRCPKGHEWQAKVNNRFHGNGCPYCRGQAVDGRNSLQAVNPVLAAEWNFAKNTTLTPQTVRPKSNKMVWWKCQQGHSWMATIISRSRGASCPECSGKNKRRVRVKDGTKGEAEGEI